MQRQRSAFFFFCKSQASSKSRRSRLLLPWLLLVVGLASCQWQWASAAHSDIELGTETEFDSEVQDIQWFGVDKNILLLHTNSGRVHRSTDHGATWSDLNGALITAANDPLLEIRIIRFQRNPVDKQVVMAMAASGKVPAFISIDAGGTWQAVNKTIAGEGSFQSWQFHAKRRDWALASHWTEGCRTDTPSSLLKPCTHSLYLTKDLGRTWSQVAEDIVQFSWGVPPKDSPDMTVLEKNDLTIEDRMYITQYSQKQHKQKRLTQWRQGVDLKQSDDLGVSFTILHKDSNKFQLSNGYMLLVKVVDEKGQHIQLHVSTDGGDVIKASILPVRLQHRSYAVLDTSEDSIILHVDHGNSVGDVFISDKSGVFFSMSLQNNFRNAGFCAFEKIMDLEGIYVANIFKDETAVKIAKAAVGQDEENPAGGLEGSMAGTQQEVTSIRSLAATGEEYGLEADSHDSEWEEVEGEARLSSKDAAYRSGRRKGVAPSTPTSAWNDEEGNSRRLQALPVLRTVMSFDKGGSWQDVAPPPSSLKDCKKKTECNLQLHAFTEMASFAPVYSYRNSIGILMGSGNVGNALSFRRSITNTYLSRDAGLTWTEVKKGTWIYEYGNHGGLIVQANMVDQTKAIEYSYDEGTSWKELVVADKDFHIVNVLIEPDAKARRFVVYGSRGSNGILRSIDFTKLHDQPCAGEDKAGQPGSDYEDWSPADQLGHCLLGRKTVYVRKTQKATCFNKEDLERHSVVRNCECHRENFVCATGYYRRVDSLECIRDPDERVPRPADCRSGDSFLVDVYRRVPGDTCVGGFTPKQAKYPCVTKEDFVSVPSASMASYTTEPAHRTPEVSSQSSSGMGLVTVIAGVVVAGGALLLAWPRKMFFSMLNRIDSSREIPNPYRRTQAGPCDAEMVGAGVYRPPVTV